MFSPEGYGLLPITEVAPEIYAAFRCGKDHLDKFLVEVALQMHQRRFSFTTLVFHQDHPGGLLGYFTLCNDEIPLNDSEKFELGEADEVALSKFPAVKIARLAVSEAQHGKMVGSEMLKLLAGEVLSSDYPSAARLLVVDADNEQDVVGFYERRGFSKSLWAEKQQQNGARSARRQQDAPRTIKMLRDLLGPT